MQQVHQCIERCHAPLACPGPGDQRVGEVPGEEYPSQTTPALGVAFADDKRWLRIFGFSVLFLC